MKYEILLVVLVVVTGRCDYTSWLELDSLSVVRDGDVYDKREIGNHAIHLLPHQHHHSQQPGLIN